MAITFWEIWTGKDPYARENTFSIYQLVVQGVRPEIPSTCPIKLQEAMKAAWNTSAKDRPSALIISQEMESIVEDFQEAAAAARLAAYSDPSTVSDVTILGSDQISSTNVTILGSGQISPTSEEEGLTENDEKYDFSRETSDRDFEESFQFDDMYNKGSKGCDSPRKNLAYTNPLKGLFRKSFTNKNKK